MNLYIDDTDKDVEDIALLNGIQIIKDELPIGCLGILLNDFEIIENENY